MSDPIVPLHKTGDLAVEIFNDRLGFGTEATFIPAIVLHRTPHISSQSADLSIARFQIHPTEVDDVILLLTLAKNHLSSGSH